MCSHKSITWETMDNTVTDRMIGNSLTHKFLLTRNLRKRTKISNSEIKKNCGVKDYKQYVELKTNVLRRLVEDIDTDDPGFLTDGDYDMIYSSPSNQAKYVAENIEKVIFTSEDDYEGYIRKKDMSKKNKGKKTRTRVQNKNAKSTVKKKKLLQAESYTKSSKKCINIGWQDVIKGNRDTLHLSNNRVHALENEANVFKGDYNYLNTQSTNQSPSLFDSHNNNNTTSIIIKSENENINHQNDGDYSANDKLNLDDTICNIESSMICSIENDTIYNSETKPVNESIYKDQSSMINQSNNELNSQSLHQVSQTRLTILDNINNAGNELNSVIKLESSDNKLTEIDNKTLINTKSDNRCVNNESNLLKNVKRNLISALEKTDSTDDNRNVQEDKSAKDRLITSDDQSLPPIANSSRCSTLLQKTRANVSKMQNLLSDTSSLDQQKDSGIDEDSQDKIERSNVKNSTNLNTARKIPVSPQQIETITETNEAIVSKDSKNIKEDIENTYLKLSDHSLGEQDIEGQKKFSKKEEAIDSSRLNKDSKDVQTCSISKEENNTHLVKQESCNIPDCGKEKSSEEEEVKDLQLNQIDKNTETLMNQEEKMHFEKPEDLCDIQNQQLSPKKERTEDAHSESGINILEESHKTVKKEEEEEKFLHLNQVDEDTKIKHEDKTHVKSEETCSIQKQQLLPKVTCTEIISKKYKIINTKINDIVNINTSIVDKDTPVKNNQNIIDNWQKINTEEIDNMLTTSETDNEEDNLNYMSPQTKKRLQQQARLNLVVNDSSESDEECTNAETLKNAGNSDTNDSSEDSKFKSDKINRTPKKTNADISYNRDVHSKETAPIPVKEVVKLNSRREINKKDDETIPTKCTYENVNSFKSATDENPLKKMQSREDAYDSNDNQNKYTENGESYWSKNPEGNSSCNSERYVNQFSKNKQSSLLDKENVCNKSNRCEDSTRDCTSEHETSRSDQNMQISTNCSNAHVDTSYRPRNLDELVEDHELLPETISPGFTVVDLSKDDEAFILNIPSKVLQYNLQDKLMLLKSKTIKFGENKYRVVRRKIGTTTCILATGKERKPYKIVNIKQVSTITVRERLSHCSRKSDIITSKSKSKSTMINNRQIEETSLKMLKISNHSKRSIENSSSDTETKQSALKKKRLKVTHS